MHLTAMGAGLLLQGKKGLRKPQVRPCFGVPKQLHSARMLGNLQRLKLLYFCSMIFRYEVLNEGRGREEIHPASRDLFFSCSKPALFWVSKVFSQLFVRMKLALSWGARGHLGLRSCSSGGLMSSPRPRLGCSTAVPGAGTPHHLHFCSPHLPFLLTHPLPSPTALLPKGGRFLPCVYLYLWRPDQRFRFYEWSESLASWLL